MNLDPVFEPLRHLPAPDLNNIPAARAGMAAMQASLPQRQSATVVFEDRSIDGPGGKLTLRIYSPQKSGQRGALLYLHGGGFMVGNLDSEHSRCIDYAELAGCVVIAVDYRLAPEFPFPAAHNDAWAALLWTVANAAELKIDPARIAVGGGSAGANLATGLALRARDENAPTIRFALLVQPVFDHLCTQPSARTFTATPFLKAGDLLPIWHIYLGASPPTGKQLSYAAPFAAGQLTGFPPTCMVVGNVDPVRDEALAFAMRLIADHTEVELHLLPGTPHGFDIIEAAPVTQRMIEVRAAALLRAFAATG